MKRVAIVATVCVVVLAYACGGQTTTDVDAGSDSAPSADAACDQDCVAFVGECSDAGACPPGSICINQPDITTTSHLCYPLPTCGCDSKTLCDCIGACACNGYACDSQTTSGLFCNGPVSRREFKTDISYLSDEERAVIANEALQTRLAEYRYKSEPEGTKPHLGFIIDDMPSDGHAVHADGTHVDLYGYTSMLLATLQEQQKQIDALKKQLELLATTRSGDGSVQHERTNTMDLADLAEPRLR
jgi:hypothetical protein